MHGWSLEDVWNLDSDDYDELVTWLTEQSDRAQHGEDATDADAIVKARMAKDQKDRREREG